MNPETPIAVRVLLGFLKAGRVLDRSSSVLWLGTLVLALLPAPRPAEAATAVGLAMGVLAKYFAWRVALDVEFFTLLQEQPCQAPAFDVALAAFLGKASIPAPRTMESRWRGARRLVGCQAGAVALQAVVMGVAMMAR